RPGSSPSRVSAAGCWPNTRTWCPPRRSARSRICACSVTENKVHSVLDAALAPALIANAVELDELRERFSLQRIKRRIGRAVRAQLREYRTGQAHFEVRGDVR